MFSIQAFTVVGVFADSDVIATPGPEFEEPIGIRQRLSSQSDHICSARFEQGLRLLKVVNASSNDNRCIKPLASYCGPDFGGCGKIAAERSEGIREVARYTFVTTRASLRIGGVADDRLFGIIELATTRGRDKIHPGSCKLLRKKTAVVCTRSVFNTVLG